MSDKLNSEIIKNENDVFLMLDTLLEKRDNEWWNNFYSNKEKPTPFFNNPPDENLVRYINKDILKKGKALDIGCGYGRNSFYLYRNEFEITSIDFSKASTQWGKQIAQKDSLKVNFLCKSIFDFEDIPESYDFIYDSGGLHHIKPHKRPQYFKTVLKYLKPDGYFAIVCFNLKGALNISDYDVYKDGSIHGGMGFSEYKLKEILNPYFKIIKFREMLETENKDVFGKSFLWIVLMTKK